MKKSAFIASLLCMALNAVAAVTPTGKLNIALNSAGQEEKVLRLRQHASFSDGFDNTWDAEAVADGGIYVIYGGDHYTTWASDQFVNLPVGFGAIGDNDYTLTFSNFDGEDITFKDMVTGDEIVLSSSIIYPYVYNFSIEDSEKNQAINDRFVINYNPAAFVTSLTTNAYGWATFSYNANVQPALPAGLKIYTGAYDGTSTLDLTEVDYVKADQGVVVYGAANTTYYFAAGAGASVYGTNHLKPTSDFDPANYSNVFVLQGEALYEYTGNTALKANKAYLQLPSSTPGAAPKRISFRFNNTTAVENVAPEAVKAEKFMENGQMFIKRGNVVYTIQGQVVK